MLFKQHRKLIARVAQEQLGFILPLAILVSLLGLAIVVPVAVLVGTAALRQGNFEDKTREFYLTDSAIMAVISDLQRGADGDPVPPHDYIPPVVNFGDVVPTTTLHALDPPTVTTIKPVSYEAAADPVVLDGINPQGGRVDLAEHDGLMYRLSAAGNPPLLSYEVTSGLIGFSSVDFGEVQIKLRSWEESARLEVFVYGADGYNAVADVSTLLDHHHDQNRDGKHKHDDDPQHWAHTHDADHDHHIDDKDDDEHDHHDHKDHHHAHDSAEGDDHHHGEETVSFFLSDADVAYLNTLFTKTLKIKIKATVFDDPDHHHHIIDREGNKGKGRNLDHIHHRNMDSPPVLSLETGHIVFAFTGPATVDRRTVAGEPLVNVGTLVSGSGSDLAVDDTSFYTIASERILQADEDDKSNFKHVVEFEVTSEGFVLSRLDTVSVPFVVRSNMPDGVKVKMFVFNPAHGPDGYSTKPDLVRTINVDRTDRAMALTVLKEDIVYLNGLSPITIKVKIRATLNKEFQLETDTVGFFGTSTDALDQPVRQVTHQFIDPGLRNPDMAVVAHDGGYLLRIYNLHPGVMNINWAFEPHVHEDGKDHKHKHDHEDHDDISIRVYRGLVIDDHDREIVPGKITHEKDHLRENNSLVANAHVHADEGASFVRTGFFEVDAGIYTIVFFNDDDDDGGEKGKFKVNTRPFAATPDDANTWIYAPAYKDYLVDVVVGGIAFMAVVRQIPGPAEPTAFPWSPTNVSWIDNLVTIESWEPKGFLEAIGAADNDGIHNLVDGVFTNGTFVDQSNLPSDDFTDQHRGGSSFGTIVKRAGLHLAITDLNDPASGLLIRISGRGNGEVVINACDTTLLLTTGDALKVTCGSTALDVYVGPVDIQVTDEFTITVPTLSTVKVKKLDVITVEVENSSASTGKVVIAGNGGKSELAPGTRVKLRKGQPP